MKARVTNLFFLSVATLLLVTGVAKLYSATGTAKILMRDDPLFHVNYRILMVALGLLEIGVATYLVALRNRPNDSAKAVPVLWLSCNFAAYRIAIDLAGIKVCPCLGTLASKLPFSPEFIDHMLDAFVLYWLAGSALILWIPRTGERSHAPVGVGAN